MFVVSKIIPIFVAMKIKEIWFDAEHIYGRDEEEREYSQSLLWYPKLRCLESVECPTISSSICGKTMKNNDSKFNQKPVPLIVC